MISTQILRGRSNRPASRFCMHHVIIAMLLMCPLSSIALHAEENAVVPLVDTHVHLWDINRPEGLYWIAEDNHVLRKSILPAVHEPIAKANHVQAVVVVQAGQHLPDNQWNLDVTAHNTSLYRGVVGNMSEVIGTDRFQPLFEKLCKDDRYVGYRLSGREGIDLDDAFFRDLEATAKAGRTVDFLVGKYSLADVDTIARRVPDLKIIIDHFGNLKLTKEPLDPEWITSFRKVAKNKNVYCKFSAFFGRWTTQPAPKESRFYQPVVDLAFECYGEDRLVYGSDWPVTRTTGDYASVVTLTKACLSKQKPDVIEKVLQKNALRFYGITLASPAANTAE